MGTRGIMGTPEVLFISQVFSRNKIRWIVPWIGRDRTILDENRHVTFHEDYTDGQSTKTRSVSILIDGVKIDNAQHPANYITDIDGCSQVVKR